MPDRQSTIDDAGQAIPNGRVDPGETDSLIVTLKNSGSGDATSVSANLTTSDIYVNVIDGTATFGTIASSGTGNNSSNPYVISAALGTPSGHKAILKLNITAGQGYASTDSFEILVGVKGEILVINDDDGVKAKNKGKPGISSTKAVGESADSIASYLTQLSYSVVKEASGTTDTSTWWGYDAIVWSDGADQDPLTIVNYRNSLINYVNGGGKLLIEGGEIAYDWATGDAIFSQTVTHAIKWKADNAGNLNLAQPTHIIVTAPNTLPNTINITYSGYGDQDACSTADAIVIYDCNTYPGKAGVLSFDDDAPDPNNGQIVFFPFNFVALSNQTVAKNLLENSMEYLLRPTNYKPGEPALISLFNYEGTPLKVPTLEWGVPSDAEGDPLHFKVGWDEDMNFGSPVTIESKTNPTGFSPIPPVAEGIGTCSYIVNSQGEGELANNSTYWWRVSAWDGSNYGNWSEKSSFTVDTSISDACWFMGTGEQFQNCILNDVGVEGDSLVLSLNKVDTVLYEGFESSFPPGGWLMFTNGILGNNGWQQTSAIIHSGSYATYHNDDDVTGYCSSWLITPPIMISAGRDTLKFWQYQDFGGWYYYHGLWIDATASSDTANFFELKELGVGTEDTWEQLEETLSAYIGNNIQIAFKYQGDYADRWYIDDVIIKGFVDADSGSARSPHIAYADFSSPTSWDSIVWHQATGLDSIRVQVEYLSGGAWGLIPDADLPGNLAGFFTTLIEGGIDISGLDTSAYDTLRIYATFIKKTVKAANQPALKSWQVAAKTAGVSIEEGPEPLIYSLSQNEPNPFSTRTVISYQLPVIGNNQKPITLKIYDLAGRLVRTFNLCNQGKSVQSVVWDGRDDKGRKVASGIYFYRLTAGEFEKTRKMVLLR